MGRRATDEPSVEFVTVIDADTVDVIARAGSRRWIVLLAGLLLGGIALALIKRGRATTTDDELSRQADSVAGLVAPQPGSGPSEEVAAP